MDFSLGFYASMISLFFGILSIAFNLFNLKTIAAVLSVVSVFLGGYLTCMIEFPVSLIGGISVITGIMTIRSY